MITTKEIIDKAREFDKDGNIIINKSNLNFAIHRSEEERNPIKKAIIIAYYIVDGHPFGGGNKRVGFYAMFRTLDENKLKLEISNEELTRIIYSLASGRYNYNSFENKMKKYIKNIEFDNTKYYTENVLRYID